MIRNLKRLGLAAFVLLAMGVMFASSAGALATKTKVHAVQYGGVTENDLFMTALGQRLTCNNVKTTFTGETAATGTTTELTITPHYTHCNTINADDTLGLPMTVNMNGCDYLFKGFEGWEGSTTFTGTIDLVCPKEKTVVIDTFFFGNNTAHSVTACGVLIGPQTAVGKVQYHNIAGTPDDITVTVNSEVTVSRTGACGTTAAEQALYTSKLTLTSSEGHDLWFSKDGGGAGAILTSGKTPDNL